MRVIYKKDTTTFLSIFFILASILLITFIVVSNSKHASADNEPVITGGSNITGVVDQYIPVTGLSITGSSATPVPVSISVPHGQLSMTTTTGLTFTGSSTGPKLSFTGNIADINAALATLRYRTTRNETVNLTVTLTPSGLVYFPGNGHLYEAVDNGGGISWDDAKIAAENRTLNGATGYLATVTSQQENDYLLGKLSGDGWFGASDVNAEGDWQWVTGPETGTSFWAGLGDGTRVGGLFANWSGGEPNDSGGDEDCAQFYSSGTGWNDLPCSGPYLNYYIVEYGGPGALPTSPSTRSFNITTNFPTPVEVPIASCLDLIDVADTAIDHRYDNLSLTANIDCTGETLAPMFSDTDPDLGVLGFRGVFDGSGHTISNLTIDNDGNNTGLIAYSDGATIKDITITGSVKGGEQCTGGLVGMALNTAFDTVSTDIDITTSYSGNPYYVGGVVGCLEAISGDASIAESFSMGSVRAYAYGGGMVGRIHSEQDGDVTMTDNEASTIVQIPGGYLAGGLIGEVESSDEGSSVTLTGNITHGILIEDEYNIGGLTGELSAGDGAIITLTDNEIRGEVAGSGSIGGLAGEAYAEDAGQIIISGTHMSHDVSATSGYIGGLIGEAGTEGPTDETKLIINDSSVTGNVSGDYTVGGLIGEIYNDYGAEDMQINDSFSTGTVTSGALAGGLVAEARGVRIARSYSTVTVQGGSSTGGLVGEGYEITIDQSYASGNVSSTGDRVGGLVGAFGQNALIQNSYARGSVTGENNVGGLVGTCESAGIDMSYATGQVVGTSDEGGLLGYDDGDCVVTDSFWDTQTSTLGSSAGTETGKTTPRMKLLTTFTDTATPGLENVWDFSTIWGLNNAVNNGYPCLLWQSESCGDLGDGDGISDTVENAAPNGGDGNNDGVLDALQSYVTSFVGESGKRTTIATDAACNLESVTSQVEANHAVKDGAYSYNDGLVRFTANCGNAPGITTNVKIYFYGVSKSGLVLRKYNPNMNSYFTINTATLTDTTIGGQQAVLAEYAITDGGLLDIDGVANGTIIDPVGLAQQVVGAPNTGIRGVR